MKSQLYIIDLSLRDGSGFDIIRWLRDDRKLTTPIIIISGYGDSQNIIYGLDLGADDYLTKPFIPEELLARIKAILRRPDTIVEANKVIRHKHISFHTGTKEVHLKDTPVYLTRNEKSLLECFLANPGKIISRDRLISEVWGDCQLLDVSDNTINVTLSKIRKKLGDEFVLKTLYNQGYVLE